MWMHQDKIKKVIILDMHEVVNSSVSFSGKDSTLER